MLDRLRLRLMLLYLLVGIGLVASVSAVAYSLMQYYFQSNTDQALKVKMGLQFINANQPLPADLYNSIKTSGLINANLIPPAGASASQSSESEDLRQRILQESELADIFVLPLDIKGQVIQSNANTTIPIQANQPALQEAIKNGYDLRTVKTSDGTPLRLLTYRVSNSGEIAFIQVGRSIKPQMDVLAQLLRGLLFLGAGGLLVTGAGAWLLSSRAIRPAQQALEKQQTFIANASHELRAPLTLVRAGVEVAKREKDGGKQRQVLEDVLEDADYMKHLIEDLLLLSRLDAHSLVLEKSEIQLDGFLATIARKMQPLAAEAGISLQAESSTAKIQADPERLQQVLFILLDNAIRNNHPGGWIKLTGAVEKNGVAIIVSDSGKGIPQEHLEKVFDRFYKVDDGSRAARKGSGLGLSIARGLVESHKGRIRLVSEEGRGTRAIIHLPFDGKEAA